MQQDPPPAPPPPGAGAARAGEPPRIEPPDPPMVPFAVVGIAIWAVLGLALLPFYGWLSRHGHLNWLWTCVAGFLLGFVGLAVMIRHDRYRRIRRAVAREPSAPPAEGQR